MQRHRNRASPRPPMQQAQQA